MIHITPEAVEEIRDKLGDVLTSFVQSRQEEIERRTLIGMRTHYAGHALTGILSSYTIGALSEEGVRAACTEAYVIANEMIAQHVPTMPEMLKPQEDIAQKIKEKFNETVGMLFVGEDDGNPN